MKLHTLKFFLLFFFLSFMSTLLATGKVLPPEAHAEDTTALRLAGSAPAESP